VLTNLEKNRKVVNVQANRLGPSGVQDQAEKERKTHIPKEVFTSIINHRPEEIQKRRVQKEHPVLCNREVQHAALETPIPNRAGT
jgi:hypothetical protein